MNAVFIKWRTSMNKKEFIFFNEMKILFKNIPDYFSHTWRSLILIGVLTIIFCFINIPVLKILVDSTLGAAENKFEVWLSTYEQTLDSADIVRFSFPEAIHYQIYDTDRTEAEIAVQSLKNEKKLILHDGDSDFPTLSIVGSLSPEDLKAILRANKRLSENNKNQITELYAKSRPYGDIFIYQGWIWISFLPLIFFLFFILVTMLSFKAMKKQFSKEEFLLHDYTALEEVENSCLNIVDGVGFSVPLFGAAILLLSVIIGSNAFLNFSIPFEIKAIFVLIIARLFTLVIDDYSDHFRWKIHDSLTNKNENEKRESIANSETVLNKELENSLRKKVEELLTKNLTSLTLKFKD